MESVKQTVPIEEKMADAVSADASSSRGFGVAASPFNGVKLELGICIILGMLLWLGADSITANEGTQLLILLMYSLSGTIWLVMRTRAVLHRCEAERSAHVKTGS
ncbi:MAG: hypothetical protein GXP18_09635 [Gammaproteobacteria bacterium]|nr:hypothetical protein [Gammaproteobacteria bacterium]